MQFIVIVLSSSRAFLPSIAQVQVLEQMNMLYSDSKYIQASTHRAKKKDDRWKQRPGNKSSKFSLFIFSILVKSNIGYGNKVLGLVMMDIMRWSALTVGHVG